MKLDERLLDEVIGRVLTSIDATQIVLFGSAARGTWSPESDLDLLVLVPETEVTRTNQVKVRTALRGLGVAVDVVLMTTSRFEETKDIIGGLAYPASREGEVIYAAA